MPDSSKYKGGIAMVVIGSICVVISIGLFIYKNLKIGIPLIVIGLTLLGVGGWLINENKSASLTSSRLFKSIKFGVARTQ